MLEIIMFSLVKVVKLYQVHEIQIKFRFANIMNIYKNKKAIK